MKSIRIFSFRKNTNLSILQIEKEYIKRLRPTLPIVFEDIRISYNSHESSQEILNKELLLLSKRINLDSKPFVCLHESGKQFTSIDWSRRMEDWKFNQTEDLIFIIGGPYGISQSILDKSSLVLSLSKMTLTHEMARLILLEQCYRAFEIIKGTPYHK